MIRFALAGFALACAVPALAQDTMPENQQPGPATGMEPQQHAQPGMPGQMQEQVPEEAAVIPDDQMVDILHHVNQQEIQLGKAAQDRGALDSVKSFGKTLVKDHDKADKDLMSFAKKQDLKVEAPTPGNSEVKQMLDAQKTSADHLMSLRGPDFDREFASTMLQDHSDVIALLDSAKAATKSDAFKSYYTKVQDGLMKHRDIAASIVGEIKAAETGAAGSAGNKPEEQQAQPEEEQQMPQQQMPEQQMPEHAPSPQPIPE